MKVGAVAASFLAEVQADYVGLWAIVWEVKRALPAASSQEVRERTMAVVEAMLRSGELLVGEFDASQAFVSWPGNVSEIQSTIEQKWTDLGAEPNIGDICWFGPA